MKKRIDEPQESMLTQRMDFGTQEFNDFQSVLLNKSRTRTENQKRGIDLLTFKYEMEDYLISDKSEVKSVGEFLKTILKTLKIYSLSDVVREHKNAV